MRRSLGLWDLVLMQLLSVLSTTWLGVASKLGGSHVAFWLAAMLLFHIPLVVVVLHLNSRMPLEGGLYQWSRRYFGERMAFMVGWNLWLSSILTTGLVGLQIATYSSYALGPSTAWMVEDPWFSAATSAVVVAVLTGLTVIGLSVGKWMHNAGGIALALTCAALLVLPLAHLAAGHLRGYPLLPDRIPEPSLDNLNILAKMSFGAFCGFEYVAILAGECREPRRAIGRSVVIASVGVVAVYILGTATVLVFVPRGEVDLVSPIAQALSFELGMFDAAAKIVPVVVLVLLGCSLAGASVGFVGTTRLPMVAGWDRVLPAWFGRLHPTLRTPVNAILMTGLMTLFADIISLIGVRHQEAYQVLLSAALILYALTYLVMFVIPLTRARAGAWHVPWWLRAAAISGFTMTLLYIVTAVFPLVTVQSEIGFSGRILGLVACGELAGVALLILARRSA